MEGGRLRQRVTVEYKVVTRDSFGGEVITWTTLCTLWASVEPLSGREFIEMRQAAAELTTRIRTRHYPGIAPEMRVTHGSNQYDIVAVIEVEKRQRELQLMCREILD